MFSWELSSIVSLSRREVRYLKMSFEEFVETFGLGAGYRVICDVGAYLLSQDARPIDLTRVAINATNSGLYFSSFNMVASIITVAAKPKLTSMARVVPFVVTTSVITSAVVQTARTVMRNWYVLGRPSLAQWSDGFAVQAANDAGFRLTSLMVHQWLPPARKWVGQLLSRQLVLSLQDLAVTCV